MPIEKVPTRPLPQDYRPQNASSRRVRDGDDWWNIASQCNMDVWRLIELNFQTRNPAEVNYYLRTRVGCNKVTCDGKNWMFSSSATPGIIYVPAPRALGRIWFGAAFKVGGTLGIAGKDTVEGWLVSADHFENRFWFNLDNWRLGLGVGASAGAAVVVVTSMSEPYELMGHALSEFDYQASMGAKWKTVAQSFSNLEKYGKLALFGANAAKRVIDVAEWEKTRDAVKGLVSALGLKEDAHIPQVAIIDIPGAGTGLEISAYASAGVFRIHDVTFRRRSPRTSD